MMRARGLTRWLLIGGVVIVLLVAGLYGLRDAMRARCWAFGAPVFCHGPRTAPVVALSFDDGPTRQGLDAILPVLAREQVHATFFLIGNEARRSPDQVRRLVAAGQEIGNHSYSHGHMIGVRAAPYIQEIRDTDAALQAAGAPPTRWFRPPYGVKFIGLAHATGATGKRMILWDVEEPAGKKLTPRAYADAVVRKARPGSIVLIHAMYRSRTLEREALPLVIAGLKRRGFRIVSVGTLLDGAPAKP